MYLEMATEEDKKMVEDWKADADGILIFVRLYPLTWCCMPTQWSQTGLFSAAVASLISVSIQDIQQNPQDTSNFYLSNIYQTLANPNGSITPTSPPPPPPPFSPPNHAVWVNALWFMSLVISLTCALLATLLQQWARRYLKITQPPRYSPHKRARIRAFFSEGVEKCLLPWTVDALPTLLHISLFLFFAGLVVFICNVNLIIFKLVLSWVGLCTALYGCMTCMPIIRHDSPYYTPLSLPAWHIVTGSPFLVYQFLRWFNYSVRYRREAYDRFLDLEESCRKSLARGMQKTAEETALKSPSEIDTRAFMWTFDCLDEDHELERFFSGLPGFRSSKVVSDPLPSLTEEERLKLCDGLLGLLNRTFSSELVSVPVKDRRSLICSKAIDPAHMPGQRSLFESSTPHAFVSLYDLLLKYQHSGPFANGIAKVLRGWENNMGEYGMRCIVLEVIVTSQPRDNSWYSLASEELEISETSLREYAAHGDDLSLLILIHVVRQQLNHVRDLSRSLSRGPFSLRLEAASKFNVKDTSPKLQNEFCALWNQIVDANDDFKTVCILRWIRNVYLVLHQDTNSAPTQFSASTDDYDYILREMSTYPVCKVSDHRSGWVPHIHDDGISTTPAHATLHDHDNTVFTLSIASPDQPSSSTHPPLPVDETFTDALPLDNQISIPGSTQNIGQMTAESRSIPSTSPSLVTTDAMHLSASEPSTSAPHSKLDASASPPDCVTVGLTTLSRIPSSDLNVLSLPSPPVLDATLPTGLLLFSAATRFDLVFSSPESHPSIIALGTGSEGNTKTGFSMKEEASYSTLGNREEATPNLDTPHLPLPSLVTNVATDDGPPTCSLGTENIEHRPPDAIVVEHTAVGHTPSSDIETLSLPSATPVLDNFLPIGMPLALGSSVVLSEPAVFSLESHSQLLAPAASGLSRSRDLNVVGEESAKAALCQVTGKASPHDDVMVTSDVPTSPPQGDDIV